MCIYARGFGTGPKWISGSIEKVTGPVSYMVRLHDNRLVRRHQDHVRKLKVPDPNETNEFDKEVNETNELDATDIFADLDLVPDTVCTPSTGCPETLSSGDTPDPVPQKIYYTEDFDNGQTITILKVDNVKVLNELLIIIIYIFIVRTYRISLNRPRAVY